MSFYEQEYEISHDTTGTIRRTGYAYPEFKKFSDQQVKNGLDEYTIVEALKARYDDAKEREYVAANTPNMETQSRDLSGLINNDEKTVNQLVQLAQQNKDNYTGMRPDERKVYDKELENKLDEGLTEIARQINNKPDLNFVEIPKNLANRIRQSRKAGYTDNQIYEELKNSLDSPFKQSINESINKGYTDKQISGYLGLKTNSNKNPEKPVTAQNIDYLSKDYDLKSKISTARISGLRDTEIYNQLLNSKTYGNKFQKALNSGFSKEEICFELGLKPE